GAIPLPHLPTDRAEPSGDVQVHGRQGRVVAVDGGQVGRFVGASDHGGTPGPKGRLTMAEVRKRGRNWYYRYIGADGVRVERKGCPDKRVTEEMARAAESEAAKVRAGLTDPKADAYRRHDARPLAEHLSE